MTFFTTVNSEIFRENFIYVNNIKRPIFHIKNLRLGYNLPTSVNDRVILPFCEGFIFMVVKFRENIILVKISEFTVYFYWLSIFKGKFHS